MSLQEPPKPFIRIRLANHKDMQFVHKAEHSKSFTNKIGFHEMKALHLLGMKCGQDDWLVFERRNYWTNNNNKEVYLMDTETYDIYVMDYKRRGVGAI